MHFTAGIANRLNLGCLVTLAPMLLPELCLGFEAAHPEAMVTVVDHHQESIRNKLRRAEISVCLTYDLPVHPNVVRAAGDLASACPAGGRRPPRATAHGGRRR